jgi:hypothetical protein
MTDGTKRFGSWPKATELISSISSEDFVVSVDLEGREYNGR